MTGYNVVGCENCGFVFADGLPEKNDFDHYYERISKYEFAHSGGQQHATEILRLEALADWISAHTPKSLRILDVGCATGELLVHLRARGYYRLTGIDPSPQCAAYAQKHQNLRVIQGVLGERSAEEPPFDLLILSAVLEHIPDLKQFIRLSAQWLTKDGMLVVEVPDAERFASGFNAPFQEFSVEHINYFSSQSLSNLLGSSGFAALATRQSMSPPDTRITSPVLTMIFRQTLQPRSPVRDGVSRIGVQSYIMACDRLRRQEDALINELVESKRAIFVWGTGTICQRLLASTRLGEANILAFVDSNPHYQGKKLAGCPIIAPASLGGRDGAILVLSASFFDEIRHQIREELGLSNQIIAIFGALDSFQMTV
jgi:SAM-dependent methyltransferase